MGSVFSLQTNGLGFTVLHEFSGPDGKEPFGSLLRSGDALYGVTTAGGSYSNGTIFALRTNGSDYVLVHEFSAFGSPQTNTDGAFPCGGLIDASGTLYGTAYWGGSNGCGTVFSVNTNGTGFAVLHNFADSPDGLFPMGKLVLAGKTLFGTTTFGGSNNGGTVFSVQTNGSYYRVVHMFAATGPRELTNTDGAVPQGGLVLAGNNLYGTTVEGGLFCEGVTFSLDFLSVSSPTRNPDGSIGIALSGLCGSTNITEAATNLTYPVAWCPLETNIADINGSWHFTDFDATNHSIRFYRSVLR